MKSTPQEKNMTTAVAHVSRARASTVAAFGRSSFVGLFGTAKFFMFGLIGVDWRILLETEHKFPEEVEFRPTIWATRTVAEKGLSLSLSRSLTYVASCPGVEAWLLSFNLL